MEHQTLSREMGRREKISEILPRKLYTSCKKGKENRNFVLRKIKQESFQNQKMQKTSSLKVLDKNKNDFNQFQEQFKKILSHYKVLKESKEKKQKNNQKNEDIFTFVQKYKKKMKMPSKIKQSPQPRVSQGGRNILSINPLLDKVDRESCRRVLNWNAFQNNSINEHFLPSILPPKPQTSNKIYCVNYINNNMNVNLLNQCKKKFSKEQEFNFTFSKLPEQLINILQNPIFDKIILSISRLNLHRLIH